MDAVLTSWAFGFGGWIGVFGSTFLFLNVPHNYTLLTLLLSPWIGGISLYLLMFATHAWINVSVQVARAMTKYEIIMAVLTSCIGVLIVGIARLIIDMERGHRTPAQAAAEESVQAATQTPPEPAHVSDKEDSESESDKEDGTDSESSNGGSEADEEDSSEEDSSEKGSQDGSESGSDETGSDETHTDDSANNADDEDSGLNEARIEDSSSSSYENINTPQLNAIATNESPVPNIPDI